MSSGIMTYELTPYTGKKKRNESRQAVVANYSVGRRDLMMILTSCGFAIPVMLIVMLFVGMWGFLVFPVAVIVAYILLGQVGGDNLQVSRLQAIDNAWGAKTGRSRLQKGDTRGTTRMRGQILIAGMPLIEAKIVDVEQLVVKNPRYVAHAPEPTDFTPPSRRRGPVFGSSSGVQASVAEATLDGVL